MPDEEKSGKHSQRQERLAAGNRRASPALGGTGVWIGECGSRTCRLSIRNGCVAAWVASVTTGQRGKALSHGVGLNVLYEYEIAGRCQLESRMLACRAFLTAVSH